MKTLLDTLLEQADESKAQLSKHRRYLHENPETGFDVENTVEYIKAFLKSKNIEILPSSLGVFAIVRGGKNIHGRIVGLRADIDALNLTECNDVPYVSKIKGKMHACGHDGHTAMLMTAADLLKRNEKELSRDVLLMFQPAEEGPSPGGAKPMLENLEEMGISEKIEAFSAIHVTSDHPVATIVLEEGCAMASTDDFVLTIKGKGGHAGQPHMNVDPLSIGAKFVTEMESYMSKRRNPFEPAVFSIGMFHGGSAVNIVAESARLAGTLRCHSEESRKTIMEAADSIIKGICQYSGAEYDLEIIQGLPPLMNDPKMVRKAAEIAETIVGRENILKNIPSSMGAEDFAYIAQKYPAVFYFIGAGNKEAGFDKSLHSPHFDFDEDALTVGVKLLCKSALEL